MNLGSHSITFGEQLKKFATGGFILTETLHEPSLVLPRHDHECANINLTIRGSFRETIGSRPQECGPASLLVKPAGESHANRYGDAGAHCLIIEVTPPRLESIRNYSRLFEAPTHIERGSLSTLAMRVYQELLTMDSASPVVIEGLVLEMLGEASRRQFRDAHGTAAPRWLIQARDILHEHFAEPLSLSGIAELVDVHPSHLARMFRKHYRTTVGEYVRRLRLEFAAKELAASNKSLAEIATGAGFYDQSHFCNEFRRFMNITPGKFRINANARNPHTRKPRSSKTQ